MEVYVIRTSLSGWVALYAKKNGRYLLVGMRNYKTLLIERFDNKPDDELVYLDHDSIITRIRPRLGKWVIFNLNSPREATFKRI